MNLILCLALAASAQPAPPAALDEAELNRRRQALSAWTHEPVALESQTFLLHLDRRDGSFFVQDRRTQVKWFSPWGRRGFASILLDGEAGWRPLDKLGGLIAQSNRLRFRAFSADPACPSLRITLEPHANTRGLVIAYEVAEPDAARVAGVRILDGALWIADADAGGCAAVAAGAGELHEAAGSDGFRRRLEGQVPFAPVGVETYTLPIACLYKQENPVLLAWSDPAAAVVIERRAVADPKLPGEKILTTTIELASPRGQVEVFLLGKDQGGVLDGARAFRDLLGPAIFERSLRYKTGSRPETRALLGAALFRWTLDAQRTPAALAALSRRLKRELHIGEALFLVAGPVLDAGLKEAGAAVKAEGHLLGVEVDAGQWIALAGEALKQEAGKSAAGYWRAALEGARQEDGCSRLQESCAPQVVTVKATEAWPRAFDPAAGVEPRRELWRHLRDTFGLIGVGGASHGDTEHAALVHGLLPGSSGPQPTPAFPVFAAALGQSARMTVDPEDPVRPDQPVRILQHLLLGEVPIYALAGEASPPLPGSGDARMVFARDEGWSRGKGLSAHDVFIKNTYEVLAPVARQRFRDPLFASRSLNAPGTARESYFGADLRVVVNFGPGNYEDDEEGFVLPPLGFFVRHPFFRAFHAVRMNDVAYDPPACIVLVSLEGKMILRAEEVRLFHAFGPNHFQFGGRSFAIDRESVVKF